jgi:hypothetical protein
MEYWRDPKFVAAYRAKQEQERKAREEYEYRRRVEWLQFFVTMTILAALVAAL